MGEKETRQILREGGREGGVIYVPLSKCDHRKFLAE